MLIVSFPDTMQCCEEYLSLSFNACGAVALHCCWGTNSSLLLPSPWGPVLAEMLPTQLVLSLYHRMGFFLPSTGFCICPGGIPHGSHQPIPPACLDPTGKQPCPWAYGLVPPVWCSQQTWWERLLSPPGHIKQDRCKYWSCATMLVTGLRAQGVCIHIFLATQQLFSN